MKAQSYTLDELATAVGMTVRNVRSYQTRGLIPAPRRIGRRSVYGPEHLRRLQAIIEARERGASLRLIGLHLSEGGSLDADTVRRSLLLPGPGRRRRAAHARGGGRPKEPLESLDRLLPASASATITAHLDDLVSHGIVYRDGRRLVTGRELATVLLTLQKHGVTVECTLQLAARTAVAATALAIEVEGALIGVQPRQPAHADLVRLVAGVVSRVVTATATRDE